MKKHPINDTTKFKPLTDQEWSDHNVIVIGRQYGSGGRRIGKLLARQMGMQYYDTELLSEAASHLGFDRDIFIKYDEKKPSMLRTIIQAAYGIADNFHTTSISGEKIYSVQSDVIKEVCRKDSCVIVGRTADYVLRNHPRMLSVFFHSPVEVRARDIMKRGEAESLEEAKEIALRHDRKKEAYYNYYTSSSGWGKAENYHLCIDTSSVDDELIVEIIKKHAGIRFLSDKDIE